VTQDASTAALAGPRTAAPAGAGGRRLALAIVTASGFAGLGYQIVWTQQSALWLGHEAAAVLAVVAAFFGGLAAGGLALGSRIERSARPARWYAGCELVIGLWSLALAALMAPASHALLELIGAQPSAPWQWSVAFGGTFVLLLPATAAMGATLPAMERVLASWQQRGASIAALYAGNTLGAVIGVLATAFWLVPEWGLLRAAAVCAALNLLCAAGAMMLGPPAPLVPTVPPGAVAGKRPAVLGVLAMLAASGLLGIGYEVLVVRVLSQVAENTVFTFAMLLAVYLLGTALGAAAYGRWRVGEGDAQGLQQRLLWLLAAACLAGTAGLWGAEALRRAALAALGPGMGAALAAEAAPALAAFVLPTVAMGALFSHLSTRARADGIGLGLSLGVNTLGAAAAPLLFGVWLLPALGAKGALLLVAGGYLALSMRRWRTAPAAWATAGAAAALAVGAPPLAFVEVPEGGHVVSYREGVRAAVSVVEDAGGVRRLRIDNRQQEGSNATVHADARQALLPALLHPAPRRALFLGLGTGVTASAAARDPQLQVDAVELLPEVIAASAEFAGAFAGAEPRPRPHLLAADARRFVRAAGQRYDLVVADNFHPARSGSGSLYTVEHFSAVRDRLAEGGVFCQWLPLHQLDLDTLRSIVRSFIAVYPGGWALLATNSLETPVVGLLARADGGRFDLPTLRRRLAGAATSPSPAELGIDDELALLGSFIAGPRALARFAGDAPVNTDDHPVVAYRAPRITYAPDSLPRDRLLGLLRELRIDPGELTDAAADPDGGARLAAYWSARNRYVEAGRDVQPSRDVHRMLAQVGEPLLKVLAISPDFRPAYDPLLAMARALAATDAAQARALLQALARLQPARREPQQILRQLSGAEPQARQ
jgi:spermidine synthase